MASTPSWVQVLRWRGQGVSVVLQYPLRRIIQILELTSLHSDHKKDREERAQSYSDWKKEKDGVHHPPRLRNWMAF